MYNRYIPGAAGYTRISVEEPEKPEPDREPEEPAGHGEEVPPPPSSAAQPEEAQRQNSTGGFSWGSLLHGENFGGGLNSLLRALHLEKLDAGDILLVLVLIFLLVEGDNMDLVITLGLILLLSLADSGEKTPPEAEGAQAAGG